MTRRKLTAIAAERLAEVEGTDLDELWGKLEQGWRGCGWSTLFRNNETGTVVGLPDHCDKIACPYCELRRVSKIRDRYRARHDEALADNRLYLITLTVPNVNIGELAMAQDRLRKAIAKLRRRSWWAAEVVGGVWRLEVTVNLKDRTWHPHANLLFETRRPIRMAEWQPRIQAEWRSVLGESYGQWVWLYPGWGGSLPEAIKRQVSEARAAEDIDEERDGSSSIAYTVKPDPHWIDPSDPVWVVEYVEALSGSRTVSSFGGWRGLPKPEPRPTEKLVVAPHAVGDDFFKDRFLPELDPLTDTVARWTYYGRGPRWALRPHRPPGDDRDEWLVWHAADGAADPAFVEDEPPLSYQRRLALEPAA